MGDFLTAAELASYLQQDAVDTTTANLMIDMAEAQVRTYCGWNITEETVTDQVVIPEGRSIFLPTLHLTAVTEVVEGGVTLTAGTHFVWGQEGEIRRWTAWWSTLWQSVTVSYVHGYAAGAPELLVIKQVVAAVVSRLMAAPTPMLSAVTVGGISEQYSVSPQVPSGLLFNEMGALAAFKLPPGP